MGKKEPRDGNIQIVSRKGNVITFPGTTPNVNFGSIMKAARIQQKISQEEIAGLMGVTRFTIMNWESNKNKPDLSLIPRLCSILRISVSDFFGMKSELSKQERILIQNLRLLKPSSQRTVVSMVTTMADKELEAHDEMLVNTTRIIDEQPGATAAGTADSGFDFIEEPPKPFFIRINDKTKNADSVVRVQGHSMEPKYHPDDIVYFEYTDSANIGDDVVVSWCGKSFIKRLAANGSLYSLNDEYPFIYEGDGSDIHILGKVLGILSADDQPTKSDLISLKELFHDELVAYEREHGTFD